MPSRPTSHAGIALGLVACLASACGGAAADGTRVFEPRLQQTSPADGAADVPVDALEVRLFFSAEMDVTRGTVTLEGGPGAFGPAQWNDMGVTATFRLVTPLAPDTAYRLRISDFRDALGTPAGTPLAFTDDALDFTTRPAARARPVLVATTPAPGATDVDAHTPALTLTFDRPMSTTATRGLLSGCGNASLSPATWNDTGTIATLAISSTLPAGATCTVTGFGAFEDVSGAPLDTTVHLQDDALTFHIAAGHAPRLVSTTPADGATDVDTHLPALSLTFDAPMDPTAGRLTLDAPAGTLGALAWDDTRHVATARLTTPLEQGRTHALEMAGFRADDGTPAADTTLHFTTAAPRPGLLATSPADGAVGVPLDLEAITVSFAQPMDTRVGAFSVTRDDGTAWPVSPEGPMWNEAATLAILPLTGGRLPSETTLHVTLDGLVTADATALDAHVTFAFRTGAPTAPRLVASSPADGATDVPATLPALSLTFDASMDLRFGTVTLAPADAPDQVIALDLGAATASSTNLPDDTLVIPRLESSALPAGAAFVVTLAGFRDAAGTPLAGDSAEFGFEIAPDTEAPTVTLKVARFLDGNPGTLELWFSEPLSHDGITATLQSGRPTPPGIAPVTLGDVAITDEGSGTHLVLPVSSGLRGFRGPLVPGTAYTFVLDGLRDVAGNLVGGTGRLTHAATGAAEPARPYLVRSEPAWGGAVDLLAPGDVVLTFSRSMHRMDDTIAAPTLVSGDPAYAFGAPQWSDDNTRATFPIVVTGTPAGPSSLRMKLIPDASSPGYRDAGGLSRLNFALDASAWQVGCFYYEELELEAGF